MRPNRAGQAQRSKEDAGVILSELLHEHWVFCNIYTTRLRHIQTKILKLYADFISLLQTRKSRRNANYEIKVADFNKQCQGLFDIFCEHAHRRKHLENEYGVKMSQHEWDFLEDQRNMRLMYCDNFVDRKWEKTMQRRRYDQNTLEKMRSDVLVDKIHDVLSDNDECELENYTEKSSDDESHSDDTDRTSGNQCKKRKLEIHRSPDKIDGFPEHSFHIRESIRKVRPTVYETMDKLKSQYHMSTRQAEAAIVVVGNKLFARKWKFHSESDSIDLDTLPAQKNVRMVGKSLEVLALAEIVNEIVNSDENTVVTYSDDGSKKQGVGSFSVQGLTVNGVYRALPTLQIASESRENLAALKIAILDILEASSSVERTSIFEKLDFVITDQTAHNFNVENIVATTLHTDHIPDHLFCNVHPSLMFNRVITQIWSDIENAIGRDKIYSSFLVNATSNSSTVTQQALDCITRLVGHAFDHKSWNKAKEFDAHIAPKKNKILRLQEERFNRLTITCAIVLYHLDDVELFLEKFEHVTSQLACIVRCFMDLYFLKVLYCAGAIIGLHLVEPFLSLTTSSKTTYAKLIPAFNTLYEDLIKTEASKLLNIDCPAFQFVSQDRFDESKYDSDICDALKNNINGIEEEIKSVLEMILPKIAEGFKKQKGNIFGFGDDENSDQALSKMNVQKLEHAPIHNLNAERSVGFINYELHRRGAKQLSCASSSQVKAKSADLIDQQPSGSYSYYKKIASDQIPEIIKKWNTKQEILVEKGLEQKQAANVTVDKRRNRDLQELKEQGGPFTNSEEVELYVNDSEISEDIKNKRLYLEIRYARDISLSIPKTSDIFRLKKDYKNLPTLKYATNLQVYLKNVTCKTSVSLTDFLSALQSLKEM